MQIFLKTLTGKWITWEVEESDSIEIVKQKIQDQNDFPTIYQVIIYSGTVLSDHKLLSELFIGGNAYCNYDIFYLIWV